MGYIMGHNLLSFYGHSKISQLRKFTNFFYFFRDDEFPEIRLKRGDDYHLNIQLFKNVLFF